MVETRSLNRYRIERELGRGASGIVYEALDTALERKVALKAVSTAGLDEHEKTDLLARFRREASAAARLAHPNIVTVFDFGHEQDTAYIVMELVPGASLAAAINAQGRLGFERILALLKQLLAGLQAAHQHGVIHRDIKPSNLLLLPDGHLKIADFGVARLESSTVTRAGTILGTPSYMAPEQLAGRPVDRRADLFSAGVILYELLTGRRPFVGDSTYSVIYQVLHADPPLPSQLDLPVPRWIDGVVQKALAKDPEERFQDAREFALALDEALRTLQSDTASTINLSSQRGATPARGSTAPGTQAASAKPVWPWAAGLAAVAVFSWGWWVSGEREAVPQPVSAKAATAPPGGGDEAPRPAPSLAEARPAPVAPGAALPVERIPASAQNETDAASPKALPGGQVVPRQRREVSPEPRREASGVSPPAGKVRETRRQPPSAAPASEAPAPTAGAPAAPDAFAGARFRANGEEGPAARFLPLGVLRQGAEAGDPRAMNQLGLALRDGRGGVQDFAQAALWFEKSGAAGNTNAMLALAGLYRDGQGVAKDPARALELLQGAAAAGNTRALALLGALYFKGEGVAQDDAKAAEYLRAAARMNDRGAIIHLAHLYELGRGVARDPQEALRLYRQAAAMGEPRARERLRQLGEALPAVTPPARAFKEGRRPFGAERPADFGAGLEPGVRRKDP
jgi:TPR repeat protein/tRNA A-37 threonylcarbamoyl transferase component Bud32